MSGGLVITDARLRLGGRAILDSVDLSVASGTLHGLLGPNGAGKSTLMRGALGLTALDSGSVQFEGQDLLAMPRRRRAQLAAFAEQSSQADVHLDARGVVMLGRIPFQSIWQAEASSADHEAVETALHRVGMADLANRQYYTLSGGEQQRLHIARALAQEPRLLLLDEPTNHLDVAAQLSILQLLLRLARQGTTVLVAMHDLNLAAGFCDMLTVMAAGRIVARGVPLEVLTPELLRAVYGIEASILAHPRSGRPLIAYERPGES